MYGAATVEFSAVPVVTCAATGEFCAVTICGHFFQFYNVFVLSCSERGDRSGGW